MIVLKSDNYLHTSFLDLSVNEDVIYAKLFTLQEGKSLPHTVEAFVLEDYDLKNELILNITEIFKSKSIMSVFVNKFGELSDIVDLTEMISSRDGITPMNTFYHTSDVHAFTIYFDTLASEYVLVSYLPTKTADNYELRNSHELLSKIVEEKYSEAVKFFNVINARRDLMFKLDPNNSLSCIEAQLDVLSKVVFLMLDKLPDVQNQILNDFSALNDFKANVTNNNVLTVKDIAKCLDEIQNIKSLVRQLQNEYYTVKQNNNM